MAAKDNDAKSVRLQVLVSTMNQTDVMKLVKNMRIKAHVAINQVTKEILRK